VFLTVATSGGPVSWMSAGVGSGSMSLTPTATGFSGTYTPTSPITPGTSVIVGTCSGAVQSRTTVTTT
jgi:hypothetical protein